jgi:hypothetical protein
VNFSGDEFTCNGRTESGAGIVFQKDGQPSKIADEYFESTAAFVYPYQNIGRSMLSDRYKDSGATGSFFPTSSTVDGVDLSPLVDDETLVYYNLEKNWVRTFHHIRGTNVNATSNGTSGVVVEYSTLDGLSRFDDNGNSIAPYAVCNMDGSNPCIQIDGNLHELSGWASDQTLFADAWTLGTLSGGTTGLKLGARSATGLAPFSRLTPFPGPPALCDDSRVSTWMSLR